MKVLARRAALAALIVTGSMLGLRAEERTAGGFGLLPGSSLRLEGDSTLHAFHSTATRMSASLLTDGTLEALPAPGDVRAFVLEIAVEGLKSGKEGLDKRMYEALAAKEHPAIRFRLKSWETDACCPDEDGALPLHARGTLSIAGVERDIVLEARLRFEPGRLAVSGRYELLMSDYGIKPPSMMMGAVKTRDKVGIVFSIGIGAQTKHTGGNDNEVH